MRASKSSLSTVTRSVVSEEVISVFRACRWDGSERKAVREERDNDDRGMLLAVDSVWSGDSGVGGSGEGALSGGRERGSRKGAEGRGGEVSKRDSMVAMMASASAH